MKISIIAAVDENNGIGKNNGLLCHLSDDLKHFKEITKGATVIMGRNTYLSLPNGALPNRTNIVLTQVDDLFKDCIICKSIDEVLDLDEVKNEKEIFIIGGASIYRAFFDIANKLYITRIHHRFDDADVFFPKILGDTWNLTSSSDTYPASEKNDFPFTFHIYEKKE